MKLQFLGHACFLLDDGVHKVLTDPFLTGGGHPEWAEKVDPDVIFVTHGHGDHVGDAAAIARRTGAPVCCTADLADAVFVPAGVACVAGNLGGTVRLSFGCAKFFQALHGGGAAGCPACGFLFEMGGRKIYHAGDTALMTDMTLLADEDIDVALLPIGDFYTMGPGGCPPGSEADPAPTDGPHALQHLPGHHPGSGGIRRRLQRGGICRQSPSAGGGDDPVSSLGRERAEHHSGCPGHGRMNRFRAKPTESSWGDRSARSCRRPSQAVLEASALKLLAETSQRLQILQGNRSEI